MTNTKKKNLVFAILSIIVFISTFYILIFPAESRQNTSICGTDEHIHTSECFELCDVAEKAVLTCNTYNYNGRTAHIHNQFCYDDGKLICPLEEYSHTHDESCYNADNTIICGIAVHQHNEQCFSTINECGETEVLVCGKNAHIHTAQCNEIHNATVTADNTEDNQTDYTIMELSADDDFYEYLNANAPPTDDIDFSHAADMTGYITAVALRYKDDANSWVEITGSNNTNMPANCEYRIDVSYKINDIQTLAGYNNQLVLRNKIPQWITPTDTNLFYGDDIAGFIAVRNGSLIITFNDSFMSSHKGTLEGSFYVYGNADWHKVNSDVETIDLPMLDVKILDFEDNLPEKYGKATIEKSVGEDIVNYNNKSYLKYTLTVQSMESAFDIQNIVVKDIFTANSRYTGYAGITDNQAELSDSESGIMPYEIRTGKAGTVVLNNGIMEWNIGTLIADETRALTYYAELKDSYTGGESKGTISNKADLFSGEYPKDSADNNFTPTANLDVTKEIVGTPEIDETGTGTISYKVRVISWANNSYALKNVRINDVLDPRYKKFIQDGTVSATVTYEEIKNNKVINSTESQAELDYDADNAQFSYNIDSLEAGDAVVLTYTINLNNILTAENSDINFRNKADIYLDGNSSGNGHIFKESFVDYTISQSSWIRKISGLSLDSERTVSVSGNIYNYGGTAYANPPSSFKVPRNSRQYQIIVNEGGAWNLSSATLHDSFRQINNIDYMNYTGFLCIEEFELDEADKTAIKSEDDSRAINRLIGLEPTRTVWVDISNKTSFDIIPSDYGLDDGRHTYLLTYYAQPKNVENVGSISVTNDFTVYGNIGNGTVIVYPGILCSVSNTVNGAIHYNAQKEAWYLTTDPTENGTLTVQNNYLANGALYWIIKVDGTVNAGFSINDIPVTDNGYTHHTFCLDSVAGVFKGAKNADITGSYEKYGDLLADGSFAKLTGNDLNMAISCDNMKLKYNEVKINSISELDGRSFVIANVGGNHEATIGDTISTGGANTGITGITMNYNLSSNWAVNGEWKHYNIGGKPVIWSFEQLDNGNFHISSDGKYISINGNGNVSMSSQPAECKVFFSDNGKICITNTNNCYLTWFGIDGGNMFFSSWTGSSTETSRQLSLMEVTSEDYLWTATNDRATLTFQRDIPLTDDEALYIVIRTANSSNQSKTSHTNNRYGNKFQVNDIINGTSGVMNTAEYTHRLAGSVLKIGEAAYSYDGNDWSVAYANGNLNRLNNVWDDSSRLSIKYNGTEKSVKGYLEDVYGSGTYAEWFVSANWDGTLSGTVDICDTLPENFEPVCVSLYEWTATQVKDPAYPTIAELDNDSDWNLNNLKMSVRHANWNKKDWDFNYYYNPTANQVRWRIENLVGESNDPDGLQNYNNSLGFIVICKVKDPDILMNGTSTSAENTVTIQSGDFMDSDNDVICINGGTSLRKNFEIGDIVKNSGNNTYEISSAKVPFIIEVNPFEEKLSKDGTLPPLIDTMCDELEIDVSSISIEYKDGSAVQGCSYVIDGKTITFSGLPDEKAISISYKTKISNLNKDSTTATVSNSVYWDTYDKPEHPQVNNAHVSFTMYGEIQLSDHPSITLIKTEQGDNAKFLANAEFELLDSNKQLICKKITDGNGMITFDKENGGFLLDYDKIYYIRETSAPSGYELDSTEKCIVILKTNDSDNDMYKNIGDVFFWDANAYGEICEYKCENEKKKIKLDKVFADGSPIDGTYSFGIYEGNNLSSAPVQTLTIEYSETSEPVYRLNGIAVKSPEFTCAEPGMQYYVYELCNGKPITEGSTVYMNGHTFEVSYTNNNYVSLTSNSITVTNRFVYYTLPEAGGKGTSIFYVISTALIAVSLILLANKSHKNTDI
ncbi:MAG: prealbumin-like fold domain-containing protein [Ruminococcus flavefaciens]|nr:prealbumin-like fold domain-containing protein [Ruminococcus flavefaciens]MCM1229862.1 prealbumin-like fold domain-containing protein [Ruminococcus flavefaciens]